MKKILTVCSLALILVAVSCQSHTYRSMAEEAFEDGDYVTALDFYVFALNKDIKLRQDEDFVYQLNVSRTKVAIAYARESVANNQLGMAYQQLNYALKHNPDPELTPMIKDWLSQVTPRAAQQLYEAALEHADLNELKKAQAKLKEALSLDAEQPGALLAMKSLQDIDAKKLSPSDTKFLQAKKLYDERRLAEAEQVLRTLLQLNPNYLPARAMRAKSIDAMTQSDAYYQQAAEHLENEEKREALPLLELAVKHWPYQEYAAPKLEVIGGELKQAEQLNARAQEHFRNKEYLAAVKLFDQVVELDPQHKEAANAADRIRHEIAGLYSAQGSRHLASGNHLEARNLFAKALAIDPDYHTARDGISRITFTIGVEAESEGRWEDALYFYLQAASHHDRANTYNSKLNAMANKLIADELVKLKLDLDGLSHANLPGLKTRLKTLLVENVPGYATLVTDSQTAVTHQIAPVVQNYNVYNKQVLIEKITKPLVATSRGVNPKFIALTNKLRELESERERAEDLSAWKAEYQQVKTELAQVPFIADLPTTSTWTADKLQVTRIANLVVNIPIKHGDNPPAGMTSGVTIQHKDETIVNPNISLGIQPDPIEFPADAKIHQEVLAAALDKLEHDIYHTLTRQLSQPYLTEAKSLERDGRFAEAASKLLHAAAWWIDVDIQKAQAYANEAQALKEKAPKKSI